MAGPLTTKYLSDFFFSMDASSSRKRETLEFVGACSIFLFVHISQLIAELVNPSGEKHFSKIYFILLIVLTVSIVFLIGPIFHFFKTSILLLWILFLITQVFFGFPVFDQIKSEEAESTFFIHGMLATTMAFIISRFFYKLPVIQISVNISVLVVAVAKAMINQEFSYKGLTVEVLLLFLFSAGFFWSESMQGKTQKKRLSIVNSQLQEMRKAMKAFQKSGNGLIILDKNDLNEPVFLNSKIKGLFHFLSPKVLKQRLMTISVMEGSEYNSRSLFAFLEELKSQQEPFAKKGTIKRVVKLNLDSKYRVHKNKYLLPVSIPSAKETPNKGKSGSRLAEEREERASMNLVRDKETPGLPKKEENPFRTEREHGTGTFPMVNSQPKEDHFDENRTEFFYFMCLRSIEWDEKECFLLCFSEISSAFFGEFTSLRNIQGVPEVTTLQGIAARANHGNKTATILSVPRVTQSVFSFDGNSFGPEKQSSYPEKYLMNGSPAHDVKKLVQSAKKDIRKLEEKFSIDKDRFGQKLLYKLETLFFFILDIEDYISILSNQIFLRTPLLDLDIQCFYLGEVVEELKGLLKHLLWVKQTQLSIRMDEVSLMKVWNDKQRLLQVLVNLSLNAIMVKREPDKNSTVEISFSKNSGMICVSVMDNGRGITPEKLKEIKTAHTGGLFISKKLVGLIGPIEEITVVSRPEGTTCVFMIHNKESVPTNIGNTFNSRAGLNDSPMDVSNPHEILHSIAEEKLNGSLQAPIIEEVFPSSIGGEDQIMAVVEPNPKIRKELCDLLASNTTSPMGIREIESVERAYDTLGSSRFNPLLVILGPGVASSDVSLLAVPEVLQKYSGYNGQIVALVENKKNDYVPRLLSDLLAYPLGKEDLEKIYKHIKAEIKPDKPSHLE